MPIDGGGLSGKFEIRNSKSEISIGEEPPRGSLDPGDSLEKVGIMVGFIGRYELVGGRNPADTRWACRRPQKPSGLPRNETSRDVGSITTWQFTYTQYSCPEISLKKRPRCVRVAQPRVTMSRFGNSPVFSPGFVARVAKGSQYWVFRGSGDAGVVALLRGARSAKSTTDGWNRRPQ